MFVCFLCSLFYCFSDVKFWYDFKVFNVLQVVVCCIFLCFVLFVKLYFCDYFICFVLWHYVFLVVGNACSSSPCLNGGQCAVTGNSYQCACQPGYSGLRCQSQSEYHSITLCFYPGSSNPCSLNLCLYGSTCILLSSYSFQCVCVDGTSGTFCGNLGNT